MTVNEFSIGFGPKIVQKKFKDTMYSPKAAWLSTSKVIYNNVHYYVIKDSGVKESTVTLLKAEPLLYEEVENYCADIDLTISDHNGYGGIKYHSVNNDYSKSFVIWKNTN